jgi:hypothetical protein
MELSSVFVNNLHFGKFHFHLKQDTIPRDTFLETDEVKDLLRGRVNLESLKPYGLVGLSKGYWSNCLISALDRYCRTMGVERGLDISSRKEIDSEIFDKEAGHSDRQVQSDAARGGIRSRGVRLSRSTPQVQSVEHASRKVESLSQRFARKTNPSSV